MGARTPATAHTLNSLAARLRGLKETSALTVRDIADRSSIPRSTVSEAMTGRRLPSEETVLAIARACGGDTTEWRTLWRRTAESLAKADDGELDQVDPEQVSTRAELVAALRELRGDRSYSDVVSASGGLLSSSTLSDMLSGRTTPTWETLRAYLFACAQPIDGWNKALDRVRRERGTAAPVRRVPVSDCSPVQLGVHAPGDDTKPLMYVPREFDRDLKEALHDAREHGGFILLVGASGTGKTRSLFEAMTRMLSDFALIHADAAPLGSVLPARTVVWFDDLDEHLNARDLDPAALNATLHGSAGPVVLLGTLRAEQYHRYNTLPTPDSPDPFSTQRVLLRLARVIDVPAQLSHAELDRLRGEAIHSRAFEAVRVEQRAIQLLTAAPHLRRRVQQAPGYAKAVIGAAVEADMSGPISAPQLYDAAARLMSTDDWAEAPRDWFDAALRYATARVHGGQSVLIALGSTRARAERRYAVNNYVREVIRRQWFGSRPDHEPELLPHPNEALRHAAPDAIEHFEYYERALSAGEHHLDEPRAPRRVRRQEFVTLSGTAVPQSPDIIDGETMRLIAELLARLEEEPQSPANTLLIAYLAALALQVEQHGADALSRALFRALRDGHHHQP